MVNSQPTTTKLPSTTIAEPPVMCNFTMNISCRETNVLHCDDSEVMFQQLFPTMFASLTTVTFIDDNAKRPVHSASEEKLKHMTPKRTKSKNRWENALKTSFPTRSNEKVEEVKQPLRRPSVDREALALAASQILDKKWDMSKPPTEASCEDRGFRSSMEARKPCRRPSVDEEALLNQLAQEFGEDDDCERLRSSLESKKPTRAPSLEQIAEMNESASSMESN